jgi:3-ketosteroid 9alpha-monooxygenase subunit B
MPSFRATVRAIIDEAPGAVTLLLEPDLPIAYRAGQFISVDPLSVDALAPLAAELASAKGRKERPRAYSLASIPSDPMLALGVKEDPAGDYPPLLSPHLVHRLRVGDVLECSGSNGFYVLPEALTPGSHVVHVCGGSGIVPNLGLIRQLLETDAPVRQTLLYANRTMADAMYREPLRRLAERHPERFELVHVLSREAHPEARHRGRIDEALLCRYVPDLDRATFYVCGPAVPAHEMRAARLAGTTPPPRFLESMKAMLSALGVPKDRLFTEGW